MIFKKNPYYSGPVSDHFDGVRFFNDIDRTTRSYADFRKWQKSRDKIKWPKWRQIDKYDVPPIRSDELRVVFVNHATFLIQIAGINILTDPVWSQRVSPISWIGPKRVHNAGIKFEDLPPIDLVLISHNHYDHLDLTTVKKLYQNHQPKILLGLGMDVYLQKKLKIPSKSLDWWDSDIFNDIKIHYTPVLHWSSRINLDKNMMLWGSFVIEVGDKKIFFAGDAGYGKGIYFKQINDKFGSMDLSLLPIGAYEPRWFMEVAHMNPEESVLAHNDLQSKQSIAMHYGCFQLTDEGIDDPLVSLDAAKKKYDIQEDKFIILPPGEKFIPKI